MSRERVAAAVLIAAGVLMIVAGASAWLGWYRFWARGNRFIGNLQVTSGVAGIGALVMGVAILSGIRPLILVGSGLCLLAALLYLVSPTWMWPPWYRKEYRHRFRSHPEDHK